ncbi:NADH-quinone oxidoreductase subunit D [Acidobacteria bacterium AH-259-O06]|nr:NADH-quinone oxidoreductase subunit D [Acidobacteria bacterium AH-259-G07]MDA2928885.1 NADH-quinone oxidoreductase subunit D [Acidobacteria bacterium AH-259-O06]
MLDSKVLEVNMGPQHPSTHGVLRVKLKLDGERVLDAECIIGYLHRGVEKISENRSYIKCVPYYDRTDYIAAVSNVYGYLLGVEKLMGIEVPKRAQYIRIMMTEFNRISSHLLWLATHALDIGAMTIFLYCFREREEILKLFEALFGARLTTHAFRLGGLWKDLPPGFEQAARKFIDDFPYRVDEYEQILTKNRIWLDRTKGVGVISGEEAIEWGMSGPPLRGSTVAYDVRKARPYGGYEEFDFDIAVGENGDTYDRYLVRLQEMHQSRRIIQQVLDRLPEGSVHGKAPRIPKPPVGEYYSGIESPRGELGYYIVSDGSPQPFRVRIRPPTFVNLQTLRRLVKGHLVADVVALIGTLDIVLGEIDR